MVVQPYYNHPLGESGEINNVPLLKPIVNKSLCWKIVCRVEPSGRCYVDRATAFFYLIFKTEIPLKTLEEYELLVLDDIGHVKKSNSES